jgi:hypothetical protein
MAVEKTVSLIQCRKTQEQVCSEFPEGPVLALTWAWATLFADGFYTRHFKKVQNILQGDLAIHVQFRGWLQPQLQLCLTVCSWMELIVCVCVVALKAQGILSLGNIRIDMNCKIIFISNFWQVHCVQC